MKALRSTSVIALMALGIGIRLADLARPLDEGVRNAQTATLTAGMIENGRLRLDPVAPWRGDLDARLVQELPVYNLVVLAAHAVPGVNLDMAGRLTSLVFWMLSFVALQALWRRTLPPAAIFWANFLFIFAPMNWYLSTAFMPESLLQLLAICFMVCVLDYARKGTCNAFAGILLTALLGLLVKFPSFVHLGLFAGLIFMDRQGWRSIFRPRLLLAAFFIAVCLLAWGEYVKAVNEPYFAEWAGWANVIGFIRPETSRLSLGYWLPLAGYNAAFITTAAAIPFVVLGLWIMARRFTSSFRSRVWLYLFVSLLASWLIWGKGAPAQNYYNLPNLVLFSASFGVGITHFKRYLMRRHFSRRAVAWSGGALAALIALLGLLGYNYLSRPDRVTIAVAEWISTNLPPGTPVAYQPRHAAGVMDYQHQPLLSHLTGRRSWILVRTTPAQEVEEALQKSPCLIVTHPSESVGILESWRRSFKGAPPQVPASLFRDDHLLFLKTEENDLFTVALRTRPL